MSTLQERLADQLAALVGTPDSDAAMHFAEHLVRYFVTRETGVDEDLVTRMDHGFASAAADRAQIRGEMRDGFAAAAADRERIEREAAADREDIRHEMRDGFAAAAADRERIEREAAAGREELRDSLVAAIEHSAATTKEDLRQEIARLADGMAMFQDAVNRRLAQMTWVTGLLFGSITILLALRGI